MARERQSATAPILAGLAIVFVALVLYVAGYFCLPETSIGAWEGDAGVVREYPHLILAIIYLPAGKVEDWFVEDGILIVSRD